MIRDAEKPGRLRSDEATVLKMAETTEDDGDEIPIESGLFVRGNVVRWKLDVANRSF